MAIRLSKVTRELNVGLSLIVDFLHAEGYYDITMDLNQKVTDEQYNILIAVFSQDKTIREEALRFLAERQMNEITHNKTINNIKIEAPAKSPERIIETNKTNEEYKTINRSRDKEDVEVFKIAVPQNGGLNIKIIGKIDLDAINASGERRNANKVYESIDIERIKKAKKSVELIAQETIKRKEIEEQERKERKEREERERKEREERERKEREERERQILLRKKKVEQLRKELEERLNIRREEIVQRERKEREEREERERKEREERERQIKIERDNYIRVLGEDLYRVSHAMKSNASSFIDYLKSNGIYELYHFTDRRNIESIKDKGGLFSWKYCVDNNIKIPFPGGGVESRSLDMRHGLSDYVRLSFCKDHPMAYVLESTKGYDTILLRVKVDVVGLEGTLFSDINATDNNHHHGGTIEDLKRINLDATKQNYVGRDSEIFKQHQAEVMVKTFIPLEYIIMPHEYRERMNIPF